jgi:hypothetical protein
MAATVSVFQFLATGAILPHVADSLFPSFEEFAKMFLRDYDPAWRYVPPQPSHLTLEMVRREYDRLVSARVRLMSMAEYAVHRRELLEMATRPPLIPFEEKVGGFTEEELLDQVEREDLLEEIKAQQQAEGLLISRKEHPS